MELQDAQQAIEDGTLNANPEDVFAYVFKNYMPAFRILMNGLGAKGKTRVVMAMMEHPLNNKAINLMSQAEKNALQLGIQVLEAKYAMIVFAQMQQMEKMNEHASVEAVNKTEGESHEHTEE